MRVFFSVLFVTAAFFTSFAQSEIPVDETTGLITYKEVVEVQGTKDELYNRGASWLNKFYVNPWEAAKVRDQSTGLIKIQHQFRLDEYDDKGNKLVGKTILYSARIEFKDGRYRYLIDNFVLKELSRYPVEKWLDKKAPDYNPKWDEYLGQIDAYVHDEFVKSLKENMIPPKEVKEDVW